MSRPEAHPGRPPVPAPGGRGVALFLAVVALAALGLISLTGLTLAWGERAAGLAALARVQARGAAEAALAQALVGWPSAATPLLPGSFTLLVRLTLPGPAHGSARLRSLGGAIYALDAVGFRVTPGGDTLGAVRMQQLVLLPAPDSVSLIRPLRYPRGWHLLP